MPVRHAAWVMPLLLSLFMTSVVSLISTYRRWAAARLAASGWSWLVAFPAVRVVLPPVRRLTAVFVDTRSP